MSQPEFALANRQVRARQLVARAAELVAYLTQLLIQIANRLGARFVALPELLARQPSLLLRDQFLRQAVLCGGALLGQATDSLARADDLALAPFDPLGGLPQCGFRPRGGFAQPIPCFDAAIVRDAQLGHATPEPRDFSTRRADLQTESVEVPLGIAARTPQPLHLLGVLLAFGHQRRGLLHQARSLHHPALLRVAQGLDPLVGALEILLVVCDGEGGRVVPISQVVELLGRLHESRLSQAMRTVGVDPDPLQARHLGVELPHFAQAGQRSARRLARATAVHHTVR